MVEVHLGEIRRTRYVSKNVYATEVLNKEDRRTGEWLVRPGFEELSRKFINNKVRIDYQTPDNDDIIGLSSPALHEFTSQLHRLCDGIATGLWTRDDTYSRGGRWDPVTQKMLRDTPGTGVIYVSFENEEDVAAFLKTAALQLKLGN